MRKSEVDSYARRPAARGLSRPAAGVYRVLLICAKADSGELRFERIGDKRLADDTGYSKSSIKRARRELYETGLVVAEEVGHGRARSRYRLVLEAVGVEVELAEARQAALLAEVAAGAGGQQQMTPVRGQGDPTPGSGRPHPTRAHPSPSGFSRPYPLPGQGPNSDEAPLRGPEEHLASGSAAAASGCPVATSRGKPCASCRACGTNPRALRRRLAAERTTARVSELFELPPPAERAERTARGTALVAAELAALAERREQAASTTGARRGADPPSGAGGAP